MESYLLRDIVLIFSLAVMVLWVCNRLGIPSIVGFLVTGLISGPHGLHLIQGGVEVEMLAEIGIMLLLFTIGLEFSLKKLWETKLYFLYGGTLQVLMTTVICFVLARVGGRSIGESILLGLLLSMSSTAIVLKSLEAFGQTDSPQGRLSLGILIFQDMVAIPIMILLPLFGKDHQSLDIKTVASLFGAIAVTAVVFVGAMKVVPFMLYHSARTRSRELFLFSVLTICATVAWMAAYMGLSLAIGAFMAGLIIAESEYRHQAIGNILPLQDIFASLFFVSIGMLLDLEFVMVQPGTIILLALGIIAIKAVVVALTAMFLKMPLRIMILGGVFLSQVGEFAFVLASAGLAQGFWDDDDYQLFLSVSLLTMMVSPSLMTYANQIANQILRLPFSSKLKSGMVLGDELDKTEHENHIVIIGFGIAGQNLARAAKESGLRYVALELNPDTVKMEKRRGIPIHFGDASHDTVLHHVNVKQAKAVAIMINDSQAAHRIVAAVRKINPEAYLIVRTRHMKEVHQMYRLGASDVISDEFGTSVEMFVRVLNQCEVPQDKIADVVAGLRSEGYSLLRL